MKLRILAILITLLVCLLIILISTWSRVSNDEIPVVIVKTTPEENFIQPTPSPRAKSDVSLSSQDIIELAKSDLELALNLLKDKDAPPKSKFDILRKIIRGSPVNSEVVLVRHICTYGTNEDLELFRELDMRYSSQEKLDAFGEIYASVSEIHKIDIMSRFVINYYLRLLNDTDQNITQDKLEFILDWINKFRPAQQGHLKGSYLSHFMMFTEHRDYIFDEMSNTPILKSLPPIQKEYLSGRLGYFYQAKSLDLLQKNLNLPGNIHLECFFDAWARSNMQSLHQWILSEGPGVGRDYAIKYFVMLKVDELSKDELDHYLSLMVDGGHRIIIIETLKGRDK